MSMQTLQQFVSFACSTAALGSTLYFWTVRANRERERLRLFQVRPLQGTAIAQMDAETYRLLTPADDEIGMVYNTSLVVANNSYLPTALLAVDCHVRFADGVRRPLVVREATTGGLLFPLNLRPLSTAGLEVSLLVAVPGKLTGGFAEREAMAGDALPPSPVLEFTLRGLRPKPFSFDLVDPASGLKRTAKDSADLEISRAA